MKFKVYLFSAANGHLFAARKLDSGDRYGYRYEHVAEQPAVVFYRLRSGVLAGEEISPGHLRGHRLTGPVSYANFMEHRGKLTFDAHLPSSELDSPSVEAIQAYFAKLPVAA